MIIDAISGVGGGGGGTTIVQKPTVSVGTYTYDGTAQGPTITWDAGMADNCVVTNATKTNAGTYTLTIALKNASKMVWDDFTTADLTYEYTIQKANQTITLSSNTVTLDPEHLTATVTVSGAKGAISVTSSASSVATASVSGSTITISNVNETTGSATITVSVAGTTNYNPAIDSTISVSAQFADFLTDWLTAANLNPASYADLDAVLADESAVRKLFTIHDAVDVIVDEVSTIESTDLTKIFNDNYVAKWVNLRDYALDTLYANSTIAGYMDTADKYFYGEWVITDSTTTPVTWGPKGNVPVMTSDTAPYGEASASRYHETNLPYKAFDNDNSTMWLSSNGYFESGNWIQYKFTNPVRVKKVAFYDCPTSGLNRTKAYRIQASNDGTNWITIKDDINTISNARTLITSDLTNTDFYIYWRLVILTAHTTAASQIHTLQFYGREMKVCVPTMTSNTTPYGEASADSIYGSDYPAWKAFDGDDTTFWHSNGGTQDHYIQYKFTNPICVRRFTYSDRRNDTTVRLVTKIIVQGSNDGTNFTDIYSTTNIDNTPFVFKTYDFDNTNCFLYYRIAVTMQDSGSNSYWTVNTIQFFGFDYSEYDWDSVKPRHYIYDHGVGDFTLVKTTSAVQAVDKDYEAVIETGTSASHSQYAMVRNNTGIDLTPYSVCGIRLGDAIKDYSYGNGWIGIWNVAKNGEDYADNEFLANLQITTPITQLCHYCDISSVNQTAWASFYQSYRQALSSCSELWLE